MTTTTEYLPLELRLEVPEPGVATTFGIDPSSKSVSRLDVCGLAIFNEIDEVEILDISIGDHSILISPVDASAYNPYAPHDADSKDDVDLDALDPRFCVFQPGIISKQRPLMITIRTDHMPLRGRLYGRRVLDGGHLISGVENWRNDPEFQRFIDLAFDRRPTAGALELMYHGWLGRARSGI